MRILIPEVQKKHLSTYSMFAGSNKVQRGEDNEKEKYIAVVEGLYDLTIYDYLKNEYFPQIELYRPIPLILKNSGSLADSEINLTLRFPQNVRVITPEKFKVPSNVGSLL